MHIENDFRHIFVSDPCCNKDVCIWIGMNTSTDWKQLFVILYLNKEITAYDYCVFLYCNIVCVFTGFVVSYTNVHCSLVSKCCLSHSILANYHSKNEYDKCIYYIFKYDIEVVEVWDIKWFWKCYLMKYILHLISILIIT